MQQLFFDMPRLSPLLHGSPLLCNDDGREGLAELGKSGTVLSGYTIFSKSMMGAGEASGSALACAEPPFFL